MKRDIDLVYLWVDGSDPQWLARKRTLTGECDDTDDANCSARYENNDELKYSLRSVEKYLPWVRNIFIVTDNQVPDWLDVTNSKVKIIDHKDILPEESLPCYNATVIECYLYKIPGLSEYFLYANDDMFVGQPLTKDFFFAEDGLPVIRMTHNRFEKLIMQIKGLLNLHISVYRLMLERAAILVKNKFGKYYSDIPHHNIDAYLKSDYQKVVEEIFEREIAASITSHIRQPHDVQRVIISYYALAVKRGHLKYVGRKESCRIRVHNPDFMKYMKKYSPKLFCLNDDQHATDNDRRRIRPFLEELFPVKSVFEK